MFVPLLLPGPFFSANLATVVDYSLSLIKHTFMARCATYMAKNSNSIRHKQQQVKGPSYNGSGGVSELRKIRAGGRFAFSLLSNHGAMRSFRKPMAVNADIIGFQLPSRRPKKTHSRKSSELRGMTQAKKSFRFLLPKDSNR
jgi:hypothetical protein